MAFPFPLTSLMLMLEMTKNNYPHIFKSGLTDDFSVRPLDFLYEITLRQPAQPYRKDLLSVLQGKRRRLLHQPQILVLKQPDGTG